ncbi:MAG: M48 family metallopeptidase [Bacteroidota bacterium]
MPLHGQTTANYFTNYAPLQSKGTLPATLFETAWTRYQRDRNKVAVSQSRTVRKLEDEYYLNNSIMGEQLRFSGKVLVNDTVSAYISRLSDYLLKFEPELKPKIHFYVLREPVMNAYTTDAGEIFISIGLISRVQTEAQLAFIMAHEIAHYKKNHLIKRFRNNQGISTATEYKEGLDGEMLNKHNYDQKQELEADLYGFELFVKAGYLPDQALSALDLLSLANYPFANTAVSLSPFESDYFKIPTILYNEGDRLFYLPEKNTKTQSSSTHPDAIFRMTQIEKQLKISGQNNTAYAIVDSVMFEFVSEVCRFEEVSLLSVNQEFLAASYAALCLLKKYPENYYLQRELLRSVYGYVMIKNRYSKDNRYIEAISRNDAYVKGGQFQRYRDFVSECGVEGYAVAGIVLGMKLHKVNPADVGVTRILTGLLRELVVNKNIGIERFLANADTTNFVFPYQGNKFYEPESDQRKNQELSINFIKSDFWRYAFVPYRDDTYFNEVLDNARAYAPAKPVESKKIIYISGTTNRIKTTSVENNDTLRMNLSSVIMLAPEYISWNDERSDFANLKRSIRKRNTLRSSFVLADEALPLNVNMLGAEAADSSQIEMYNLLMYTTDWLEQICFFEPGDILPAYNDSLNTITTRTGTRHIAWAVMMCKIRPREQKPVLIFTAAYLPLIRTAYFLVTPHFDSFFYYTVYDLQTGVKVVEDIQIMPNQLDDRARIRQSVYDFLYKLNRK